MLIKSLIFLFLFAKTLLSDSLEKHEQLNSKFWIYDFASGNRAEPKGDCIKSNKTIYLKFSKLEIISAMTTSNKAKNDWNNVFIYSFSSLPKKLGEDQEVGFCFTLEKKMVCGEPRRGDLVMVKLLEAPKNTVDLCHLKFFTCKAGFYGYNCSKVCNCDGDDVCSVIDGTCPHNRCAAGYFGNQCRNECINDTYGVNCKWRCYCKDNTKCNRVTGVCSAGGCKEGYFGKSCQTKIPDLPGSVAQESSTQNSMDLYWPVSNRKPERGIVIKYYLLYRLENTSVKDAKGKNKSDIGVSLNSGSVGVGTNGAVVGGLRGKDVLKELKDAGWIVATIVQGQQNSIKQRAKVENLKSNSHYQFIVVASIQLTPDYYRTHNITSSFQPEEMFGTPSPVSSYFKTKCRPPEPPNANVTAIRNGDSFTLHVFWQNYTKTFSNCNYLLHFIVYYKASSSPYPTFHFDDSWSSKKALPTANQLIISDSVVHGTLYMVKVAVVNDEGIMSFSGDLSSATPYDPKALMRTDKTWGGTNALIIVITIIILVAIAFFIFIFIRRSKRKQSHLNYSFHQHTPLIKDEEVLEQEACPVRPPPPKNLKTPSAPVKLEDLEALIARSAQADHEYLISEYKNIFQKSSTGTFNQGKKSCNESKNRFKDVIPYDHSRVVLEGDPQKDYINASFIDGNKRKKMYIAAQGCSKGTVVDWWKMCWQVKCRRIVMLTNLVERGAVKCHKYWPEDTQSEMYGTIRVSVLDTITTSYYTIRTLSVQQTTPLSAERRVKHFHFTAWPDHGVPADLHQLLHLRDKIRALDGNDEDVIVIHCSAGIGRTGALIACDRLIEGLPLETVIDVASTTASMRLQRCNMIQKSEQYIFVYKAVLQAYKKVGRIVKATDMETYYVDIRHNSISMNGVGGKENVCHKNELLRQFSSLYQNTHELPHAVVALERENKDKNRYCDIYPNDVDRPYLTSVVEGTSDYINATYLDGHNLRNEFICTQMPLPHTVIDMWRLVFENDVKLIIMTNSFDKENSTYGQYWPDKGEECECGPFKIECLSNDSKVKQLLLSFLSEVLMNSSNKSHYSSKPRTITMIECLGIQYLIPTPIKTPNLSQYTTNKLDLNNNNNNNLDKLVGNSETQLRSPQNKTLLKKTVDSDLFDDDDDGLVDVVCEELYHVLSSVEQLKCDNSPIVIHCDDGQVHSGMFAALSVVNGSLRREGEVDVCMVVEAVHKRLPAFLQSPKQLQLLYKYACYVSRKMKEENKAEKA